MATLRILKKILILIIILPQFVLGDTTYYYPVTVEIPQNIKIGDQIYEGSFSGLREYLDENLQENNSKIYKKLDPKLKELERKVLIGEFIFWGSLAGGTIYAVAAPKHCVLVGSYTGQCIMDNSYENLGIGLSIFLIGWLVAWIYSPGRKETLKFINDHNKLNKEHPIELKLGLAPSNSGLSLLANINY